MGILFPVELEPVASADGWTLSTTVQKIEETPGGTRHILQAERYNYKAGPEGEGQRGQGAAAGT